MCLLLQLVVRLIDLLGEFDALFQLVEDGKICRQRRQVDSC